MDNDNQAPNTDQPQPPLNPAPVQSPNINQGSTNPDAPVTPVSVVDNSVSPDPLQTTPTVPIAPTPLAAQPNLAPVGSATKKTPVWVIVILGIVVLAAVGLLVFVVLM